ncbi:uncharacterized protein LOC135203401 [Macrobrachium nipponense]|uniref:uncharacterized protein LOC135203401 n=1 Tax=Macrobrachium nipponense TaxID=159736 RepID=UPI0030C8AA6D
MASLDVESLFTNVPVDETIGIIMERVYRNPDMRPPNIPEDSLRTLLDICMKRAPFTTHRGQMYRQKDGIAMRSPLGVLFSNFYMGEVEERVFSQHRCPRTYGRYINDIFVQADCKDEVEALRQQFLQHSMLNFTFEYSSNDRLPFLDVLVTKTNQKLVTTVYTKATNVGLYLNGDSDCSEWFKTTTIKAFIRRALSHSFMHHQYKEDEVAMKKIIEEHIRPIEEGKRVSLIIYYKNRHTKDLLMKNNPSPPVGDP